MLVSIKYWMGAYQILDKSKTEYKDDLAKLIFDPKTGYDPFLERRRLFGYCTGVFVFTQSKRVSIIGFLINLKIQDSPKMRLKLASINGWNIQQRNKFRRIPLKEILIFC